jgi:S-adenosylmethionine:tRNA ribosyltransferase-isomerase
MVEMIDMAHFSYPLDESQIAKYPVSPRDQSKLLVFQNQQIIHGRFASLASFLPSKSFLVLNNTKVIPARLHFQRISGATIEVFLLNPIQPSAIISQNMASQMPVVWQCAIGNKKKWKKEETLFREFEMEGELLQLKVDWHDFDNNQVRFSWNRIASFSQVVNAFGKIPLPPYLNREVDETDADSYQTVYSLANGAVAAPTAGLHFSDAVFEDLKKNSHQVEFVTLHVGAGTFMPVKVNNALDHPMHEEQVVFKRAFIEKLLQNTDKVIPVGTTSMRSLESLYWFGVKLLHLGMQNTIFFIEKLFPYSVKEHILLADSLKAILTHMESLGLEELVGSTEIMIFPGYKFKVCAGLITNFHQPNSTLLLLVAALIGENEWKEIYRNALENEYRFLSFGDSSLLLP